MARLASALRLALLLTLAWACGFSAQAREPSPGAATAAIALADLPAEARQTLALIRRGGPFPFPHKDGSIFGNFERRLPQAPRGYYREYTVPTPGLADRGARRIVAGGGDNVSTSDEYYYTGDHYRTFLRIRQ